MSENVFEKVPGVEKPAEQAAPLPEELKGKTPEDMYKMLQEEHNRVVDGLQTQHQHDISLVTETKEKVGGQKPGQTQQPQQQKQFVPPVQQQPAQETPDSLTQPEEFFASQFQRRIAPLANAMLENQKNTNRQVFQGDVGKEEWEKYGGEIEQFVGGLAPAVQSDYRAYQTAYQFVKATHLDEISKEQGGKQANEVITQVLAAQGYTAEQIQQAIAGQTQQPAQQQRTPAPQSSLFQGVVGTVQTGLPSGAPATVTGQRNVKTRLTTDQKRMAEEFEMTDAEYIEYAQENTDILSNLARGEQ